MTITIPTNHLTTGTATRSGGPVCDHCRTSHSPAGWWAAEDGAQLCNRCWQDVNAVPALCPLCLRPPSPRTRS